MQHPGRAFVSAAVGRRLAGLVVGAWMALQGASASAADLTVSAAASLTDAFREIGARFEATHAGTRVRLNFAASGALLQQIVHGAPVDVFASADVQTMDEADRRGMLEAGTRVEFAGNALVVVVPRDARRPPASLEALVDPSVRRIAIGLPASVPVGRYSQAALAAAGLWPAVQARMIGAHSVRQALDYVARAEVDAAFVYRTDAALLADRVRIAFTVPTTPVRYPIAAIADSRRGAEARQFIAFVVSPIGQGLLAKHGFDPR